MRITHWSESQSSAGKGTGDSKLIALRMPVMSSGLVMLTVTPVSRAIACSKIK